MVKWRNALSIYSRFLSEGEDFSGDVGAATDLSIYNFTEITTTTPLLTRILDRLIGEVSAYVAMAYDMASSGRHNTENTFFVS